MFWHLKNALHPLGIHNYVHQYSRVVVAGEPRLIDLGWKCHGCPRRR